MATTMFYSGREQRYVPDDIQIVQVGSTREHGNALFEGSRIDNLLGQETLAFGTL